MPDAYENVDEPDLEVRVAWRTRPQEGWGLVITLSEAHRRRLYETGVVTSGKPDVDPFPNQVPLVMEGMPELFDGNGDAIALARVIIDSSR